MKIGGNVFGPPTTLHYFSCPALIACRQVLYFSHKSFQRQKFYRLLSNTQHDGVCPLSSQHAQKQTRSPDSSFLYIVSTLSLRFNLIMCTQGCLFGLQLMKHFEMLKALALNCMLILKSLQLLWDSFSLFEREHCIVSVENREWCQTYCLFWATAHYSTSY